MDLVEPLTEGELARNDTSAKIAGELMTNADRIQLAKDFYNAFMSGDRTWYEEHLSDDLVFSSPVDVGLDRAGYFERCWPGSGHGGKLEFIRMVGSGDEVIVTYESVKPDGSKGRNTEILGFRDTKLTSVEVYFGWDVPARRNGAAR